MSDIPPQPYLTNMTMQQQQRYPNVEVAEKSKRPQKADSSTAVTSGSGTGKRKRKDPNAPKRNMSAFFHYCSDERARVRAQMPNVSVAEIAKELGRRWAAVQDRTPFDKKALDDKEKAAYEAGIKIGSAQAVTAHGEPLAKKRTPGIPASPYEDADSD
ncbi:uncharacterized protein LOC129591322 isoform X2 [Paramacrobiotus metropolitanus]|uniref:uncharacterized protein LOC129591322 isoform X2 n=1 Tax=Paramacrobiotus metropolitanus TaxID=2943436 RepID=UPI0024458A55|nr:uncharacterized protein LOC129591322 isoform X2 [Paramacrobiotus metropolitanus]